MFPAPTLLSFLLLTVAQAALIPEVPHGSEDRSSHDQPLRARSAVEQPRDSPNTATLPTRTADGVQCNLDAFNTGDLSMLAKTNAHDSLFDDLMALRSSLTVEPADDECTEVARKGNLVVLACNESGQSHSFPYTQIARLAHDIATVCGGASTDENDNQVFPSSSAVGNGQKNLNGALSGPLSVLVRGKAPSEPLSSDIPHSLFVRQGRRKDRHREIST